MADNSENAGKKRRGPGRRFVKGESGNPGGRKRSLVNTVRDYVGEDGEKLIQAAALIAWGKAADVRAFFGEPVERNAKARMEAINMLADRGFGKAPQEVALTGGDGEPVRVVFGGRYKPQA